MIRRLSSESVVRELLKLVALAGALLILWTFLGLDRTAYAGGPLALGTPGKERRL